MTTAVCNVNTEIASATAPGGVLIFPKTTVPLVADSFMLWSNRIDSGQLLGGVNGTSASSEASSSDQSTGGGHEASAGVAAGAVVASVLGLVGMAVGVAIAKKRATSRSGLELDEDGEFGYVRMEGNDADIEQRSSKAAL